MHKFLKKYLLWFPLLLLIALPCSAKRELKVLMNVVQSEQVNFSKGETIKLCAGNFAQIQSEQKSDTYRNIHLIPIFSEVDSSFLLYRNLPSVSLPRSLVGRHFSISIFLFHKKLII